VGGWEQRIQSLEKGVFGRALEIQCRLDLKQTSN
jgi:hypothetical protein